MSWSEPRRAVLAALALAACGFTPLYAPGTPAAGMGGRVEVAVVEGAPGFAMREELTARLGPATAPTHRLDVTLRLEQTGVALTEQDVTTRYNVTGTADYALVPLAGGPPAAQGTVRAITGYSAPETVTSSAYASLAAERDAERRLAIELADRIVQRLALSAEDWT
jgi:LPS-assembly lipoprotein